MQSLSRPFRRQWRPWTDSDRYLSAPQGHLPTLESFYRSIGEGCQICTVLCDSPKIQKRIADLPFTHTSHLILCQRELWHPTPNPDLRCFGLNFIVNTEENIYSKRPFWDADARFTVVPAERKWVGSVKRIQLIQSFRLLCQSRSCVRKH